MNSVEHVEPGWLLPRIVAAARSPGAFGICGVPDVRRAPGPAGLCRRNSGEITWALDPGFAVPGLARERCRQLLAEAFAAWARVCGIRPREVTDLARASIAIRDKPMGGPYGVLATCGLPCGVPDSMPMPLDVDSSEASWPEDQFRACVVHEIGHGLGLDHAPGGSPNVMAPVLNLAYPVPQPTYDIPQIVARYGTAPVTPPPTPGPPTPRPPTPPDSEAARVVLVDRDGTTMTIEGRPRRGNPTGAGSPRVVVWLPQVPYKLTYAGEPRQAPR